MEIQSHDDAVDLVKSVFQRMGGQVVPPRRPHHNMSLTPAKDTFLMDFENACLSSWFKAVPTGRKRYENKEWAALIQAQVYPHHSDVDWHEYVQWVSRGYGDEWFQGSESEPESEPEMGP